MSREEMPGEKNLINSRENWSSERKIERELPASEKLEKNEKPDLGREKIREFPDRTGFEKPSAEPEKTGEFPAREPLQGESFPSASERSVEIKNLVKLGIRGEKEEKEAVSKARKLFEEDPHALDSFHDQLLAEKRKANT